MLRVMAVNKYRLDVGTTQFNKPKALVFLPNRVVSKVTHLSNFVFRAQFEANAGLTNCSLCLVCRQPGQCVRLPAFLVVMSFL